MRIKNTISTGKAGLGTRLTAWWGARHNLTSFAVAVSIGALLAGSISLWYTAGGRQLLDYLTAPLRAEAQKTVEEVTVTNDLPTLYFDIGFAEFQAMAAQREEAL
ncbi:MAG: hypothetical protein DRI37_04310, partial [Chloroflexi bacterium]